MPWIAVFIGGGLGSMVRYAIARVMNQYGLEFAWATLLANLISSIILGGLLGWVTKEGMNGDWRLFWMVGFCGGFSTFSTFTAETYHYMQQGNWTYAIANIAVSVLICLLGYYLGLRLVWD